MTEKQNHKSLFVNTTEFVPLLAFLLAFYLYDIFVATAVLMFTMLVATGILYIKLKIVPRLQLGMLAIVLLFGSMTLYFDDPDFIKMKPTITLALLGGVALASVLMDKPILNLILPPQHLEKAPHGFLKAVTWRFGLFYFALAVLNEFVWRTQSTEFWVNFKIFGIIGLTIIFVALHIPWVSQHFRASRQGMRKTQEQNLSGILNSEVLIRKNDGLEKQIEDE